MGQTLKGAGIAPENALCWVMLVLGLLTAGCSTSIQVIGTVPETNIACYSIKDRDFFVAGILLLCTQDGQVKAASGGAASGAAGLVGNVVQGAGILGAGIAVGSGIRSLTDIHGVIDEHVKGTVHLVPAR